MKFLGQEALKIDVQKNTIGNCTICEQPGEQRCDTEKH